MAALPLADLEASRSEEGAGIACLARGEEHAITGLGTDCSS